MKKHFFYILIASLSLVFFSCGSAEEIDQNKKDNFEKKNFLENYARVIIQPAYTTLSTELDDLKVDIDSLVANPNSANLGNTRKSFVKSYKAYQAITFYNFGPSSGDASLYYLNIFPVDTSKIQSNIKANTFNNVVGSNSCGFPALDYLLFESDSLDHFTSQQLAFIQKAVTDISTRVSVVKNAWTTYETTFIGLTSSDPSGGVNLFVNAFLEGFEISKNFRIGLPVGKKGFTGDYFPKDVEAYYSGISTELMIDNINGYKKAFTGGSGVGLDDYLVSLGQEGLKNNINKEIENVYIALDLLDMSLSEAVIDKNAEVKGIYDTMVQLIVYTKSDMVSYLNVLVQYSDGDGD